MVKVVPHIVAAAAQVPEIASFPVADIHIESGIVAVGVVIFIDTPGVAEETAFALFGIFIDLGKCLAVFPGADTVDAHIQIGSHHFGKIIIAASDSGIAAGFFHQFEHFSGVAEDFLVTVTAQLVELIPVDADPVFCGTLIDGTDAVFEKLFVGRGELFRVKAVKFLHRKRFIEESGDHIGKAPHCEPAGKGLESCGIVGFEEVVKSGITGFGKVQLRQIFALIEHFKAFFHIFGLAHDLAHGFADHITHTALVSLQCAGQTVVPDELELGRSAVVTSDDRFEIFDKFQGGDTERIVQSPGGEIPAFEKDFSPVDAGLGILRDTHFEVVGKSSFCRNIFGGFLFQKFGDIPVAQSHKGFSLGPDTQITHLRHREFCPCIRNCRRSAHKGLGRFFDGVKREGFGFVSAGSAEHHQLAGELIGRRTQVGVEFTQIVNDVAPQTGVIFPQSKPDIFPAGLGGDILKGGGNGEFAHGSFQHPLGTFGGALAVFAAFGSFGRESDAAQLQIDAGGDDQTEKGVFAVNSHLGADGEVYFDIAGIEGLDVFPDILIHVADAPVPALVAAVNDDVFVLFQQSRSNGEPDLSPLHIAPDDDNILFLLPLNSSGSLFTGKLLHRQIGT